MTDNPTNIDWANLSEREWKERLTPMEFNVLRKEGTERPGTSELNGEASLPAKAVDCRFLNQRINTTLAQAGRAFMT